MIYQMPYEIWNKLSDQAPLDPKGLMMSKLIEDYIENTFGLHCTGLVYRNDNTHTETYEYQIVDQEKFKELTVFLLKWN